MHKGGSEVSDKMPTEALKKIEKRERSASETSENDYDPQFKPIVSLPEVEVSTNEEHEEVLLKSRAKLYRFDKSSEPPEWKERGTGEMKILQHKENFSVRLVMRRDKTLKVCANHFITPWMELTPYVNNNRAFVYTVLADFADEKPKSECLAIKFASVELANFFKTKFEEAKNILREKCSLYNGEADKDDEEQNEENEQSDAEDEKINERLSNLSVHQADS